MSATFRPRVRKRIGVPEITGWLRAVESGSYVACEEQKLLAAFVRRVFASERLFVNREQLATYMGYQRFFPFELDDWERFLVAVWLCTYREDGRPRFRELFCYLGRGSGKNGFITFCSFCLTSKGNGIERYNVDICATTEAQAMTSFKELKEDVLEKPGNRLSKAYAWTNTVIQNKATKSEVAYYTKNPDSKDGLRSGCVVFDEVHAYPDQRNIGVFKTGLGKKPHPRILYCTTDGNIRDGVIDDLKKRARAILKGEQPDNGMLPFMCCIDAADDIADERNWHKANPHLRFNADLMDEIRGEYDDYRLNPIANPDFMTKRMNFPVGRVELEVASWEDILATNRELPEMSGMPCVVGIDFARTTDFVSAVLLFRKDGTYYARHHSWFCSRSKHRGAIKAPLDDWAERGLVTIVDDVEINPDFVTRWVFQQSLEFNVQCVAIDDYRYTMFQRQLENVGFSAKEKTVYLVRPSDVMRIQPVINSAFVTRSIAWGDDPAMRWFTNNAKLEPAPNNNFKYGKIEPKGRKTDGFMAFVAAMAINDRIPDYAPIEWADVLTY
ncbi:terminase TerL endonuclease subunit [Berryella intestinalis]|uniref:terminase TerL endonuclease subunit n=1 Tax=Berryella intestinalis TaxID=1531429 RepID=UPI00068BEFFC|nr:terminase TerL endonuclease subunit [Berryella intestinalis]